MVSYNLTWSGLVLSLCRKRPLTCVIVDKSAKLQFLCLIQLISTFFSAKVPSWMKSAFSATDRIVGGANAGSAIPWQVSLRQRWVVFSFSYLLGAGFGLFIGSLSLSLAGSSCLIYANCKGSKPASPKHCNFYDPCSSSMIFYLIELFFAMVYGTISISLVLCFPQCIKINYFFTVYLEINTFVEELFWMQLLFFQLLTVSTMVQGPQSL